MRFNAFVTIKAKTLTYHSFTNTIVSILEKILIITYEHTV